MNTNPAENQNQGSNPSASPAPQAAGAPQSQKTITVSEKALKEIKRLIAADESTAGSHLRVMVVGGGCSGMSYKLGFEKLEISTNDKVFDFDGVKVVCDGKSFLYLAGTQLDFSDGLNGTGFTFNNPNAKRTCGCGSSFSA